MSTDNPSYPLQEMIPLLKRWRLPFNRDQALLALAAVNVFFLGVDIYLAHSLNGTLVPYEWIPIIFSPIAGVILLIGGWIAMRNRPAANLTGSIIFGYVLLSGFGIIFPPAARFSPSCRRRDHYSK